MATPNGVTEDHKRTATTSPTLRKRKRSPTPEKSNKNNPKADASPLQQSIDNVVRELRKHDFAPALLQTPSLTRSSRTPPAKRLRTHAAEQTIESRVAAQSYSSLEDFLNDIQHAEENLKSTIDEENDMINKSSIRTIDQIVSQYQVKEEDKRIAPVQASKIPGEALSLRGTIEGGGVRQLFSGLRRIPEAATQADAIDAKILPNGFDVVEAATLDPGRNSASKDMRTFGDVFKPHRNVKSLELPRTNHGSRKKVLDFVEPLDELPPANKNDFKYQSLHSGSWLNYSTTGQELKKKQGAIPALSDSDKKSQALFKASYSSFAPSYDNTDSLVASMDRSRQWWRKYGSFHPLFADESNQEDDVELPEILEDRLDEFVENYESEELEDALTKKSDKDPKDGEELLSEVSDLLQTLSSYQFLRDSDKKQNPSPKPQPSDEEFNVYELLKTQLKLLIESLPPFAIAKLNGDQLDALNISTEILVRKPEYTGTGQADEYTLRRNRAAQPQQSSTVARPAIAPQGTSGNYHGAALQNTGYNAQARPYTANATPAAPGYGQRPGAPLYNTPRPGTQGATSYGQTPYRSQQPFPNATIQQYQRSLQNGYNQAMATQYGQRPATNTYQPQTPSQYGRSESPQKPLTNGQTPAYPSRQHGTPQQGTQATQAYAQAHATIQQHQAMERMKALQEAQKQASSTPQPAPNVNGTAPSPTPEVAATPSSTTQPAAATVETTSAAEA